MSALHRYSISQLTSSIGSSTTVHAIRIATPSTRLARLVGLEVATSSVTASDTPLDVYLLRTLSSGLTSGGSSTPIKLRPGIPASLVTGTTAMTVGSLSGGETLFRGYVPAVSALLVHMFPPERAPELAVSDTLDLLLVAGSTALTNVRSTLIWEE